jgi:chromosome segregation ATPase
LARRRRKERQKALMVEGKKAADTMSSAEHQVTEAAKRADRLEAEAEEARSALGTATSDLAEARASLALKSTLLDGLEGELAEASKMVKEAEAERDAARSDLARVSRELAEAREADSDARSLRNRLKAKSEEIVKLADQIRRLKAFLDSRHLLQVYLNLRLEDAVDSSAPTEPVAGPAGG